MPDFASASPFLLAPCSTASARLPLHGVPSTRALEQNAARDLPPHALMQHAGLAVARVALAVAPHAQTIWIACGYGNNGGDGLQAAAWLQRWGKRVQVSALAAREAMPPDAQAAWQEACTAGVHFTDEAPALQAHDLCIDALLGIGMAANRPPDTKMQTYMAAMRHSPAQVLAVDIPSGLLANTGNWAGDVPGVCADHTVTLLTLKPGLFTAHGRDAAGQVWWHDLGVSAATCPADAYLQGARLHARQNAATLTAAPLNVPDRQQTQKAQQKAHARHGSHNSHKGSYGDVCVIGGDAGMQGAAFLAGEAALYSGAGRVYVALLQAGGSIAHDVGLMVRQLSAPQTTLGALPCEQAVTVYGCGGGQAVAQWLPAVLQRTPRLVLDADALNAIAASTAWQALLRQRARQGAVTVLTPHPLEAARLLQATADTVQHNRLDAARTLAEQYQCAVVLKGSGSICALPATVQLPFHQDDCPAASAPTVINYSGNARLATAGTGDVLAGCIGAYWAQAYMQTQTHTLPARPDAAWHTAWRACCAAVHAHSHVADMWHARNMRGCGELGAQLSAQRLARSLQRPDYI